MYEAYWNLNERPFQNTPDPRFFYVSPQYEDVLMKLTYVIVQGLGAGMLTGIFGCGKTLIARVILRDLGESRFRWAYVSNPSLNEPVELVRSVLRSLSPNPLPDKRNEIMMDSLLEQLYNVLLDNAREGKENIVIVDEAHTIDNPKVFEQLRMMLNFQTEEKFLLTLLVIGQPELTAKVDAIKPFAQRIPVRCSLEPLPEKEVGNYIKHRIKVASKEGAENLPNFEDDAVHIIYEQTGGIPRKINTICDFVLLSGFAKKKKEIKSELVNSVIKEFNVS